MAATDQHSVDSPPKARINRGCLLIAFLGLPILAITLFGYRMFVTKQVSAEVLSHRWERSVDVETLRSLHETAPCNRIPLGAYSISEQTDPQAPGECSYQIDRWEVSSSASEAGEGLSPAPHWPEPKVDTCVEVGCRRGVKRSERYLIDLLDSEGEHHECSFRKADWSSLKPGMKQMGKKSIFLDAIACRSFLPGR